jgi:hypothetical protein
MSQNDIYYQKYLKYKSKYLELKKSMIGAGTGGCKKCSCPKWGGYSTTRYPQCANCPHTQNEHR